MYRNRKTAWTLEKTSNEWEKARVVKGAKLWSDMAKKETKKWKN